MALYDLHVMRGCWAGCGFLMDGADLADFIQKGQRPVIPDSCPLEYAQLIMRCWDQDPDSRYCNRLAKIAYNYELICNAQIWRLSFASEIALIC